PGGGQADHGADRRRHAAPDGDGTLRHDPPDRPLDHGRAADGARDRRDIGGWDAGARAGTLLSRIDCLTGRPLADFDRADAVASLPSRGAPIPETAPVRAVAPFLR